MIFNNPIVIKITLNESIDLFEHYQLPAPAASPLYDVVWQRWLYSRVFSSKEKSSIV